MCSIFGNVPCTLNTLPNIISQYDFLLIYCYFSFSIATPSIIGNAHWILKKHPKHYHEQWAPSPLIFMDFSHVICFLLLFSIATYSIFGNAHCTLKALPNIITNSGHHLLFLLVKFPLFIPVSHLQKHTFLYLKVHPGPWKQCPMLSLTVCTSAELCRALVDFRGGMAILNW